MIKRIIILTKSSKHHAYCVAAIDIESKKLIRLVSNDINSYYALTDSNLRYADNSRVEILDCVDVVCIKDNPTPLQPENLLIDTKYKFEKIKKYSINDCVIICPTSKSKMILGNNSHLVSTTAIHSVGKSIEFIEFSNGIISGIDKGNGYYKFKLSFFSNGVRYQSFSITDPDFYQSHNGQQINSGYAIISLPDDEWSKNNGYYKFVAKIFFKN